MDSPTTPDSLNPQNVFRRCLFTASALALGCILAIGGAEIAFRILHGDRYLNLDLNYFPPRSVIYDSELGWAYRPGYEARWKYFEYEFNVQINSLGLRGGEIDPDSEGRRSLFVGDSFTFGVGVEEADTFVARTGNLLGGSDKLESINGGRIAAGPDTYLAYVHRYVDTIKPNLLIACLFPENDFDDTRAFHAGGANAYKEVGGEVYRGDQPLARERHHRAGLLFRSSAFYRFLRLRFSGISINMGENPAAATWLDVYLKEPPEWVGEAEARAFESLEAIAQICRERGIAFAVVLIPSDMNLDERLFRRIVRDAPSGAAAYDSGRPFEVILDFARRSGIDALDLRDSMAGDRGTFHFEHDRHFNARGHEAAAEAIADFVVLRGLLGAPSSAGRETSD